ncbi:hypothetical protein BGZ97_011412 [Linnemannia gamsii]|uniref:F-box domain-containing protein n=1 Tax=Linnemannia gamsii TaxID=64522 RepID=A0A9P6RL00_9FUNG|nr:hypothetical protein BGZ97_011412 [Linnemannia gamsii]
MESAGAPFLTLELLTMVGSHLSTDSLARALTVNEAFYDAFTPLLYRALNWQHTDRILSARATAFAGLFNNARHVRSISMSGEFCIRLVHGFIKHINSSSNTATLDLPEWIGLLGPSDDVQTVVPLLPFPCLTRLTCQTRMDSYLKSRELKENYYNGIFLAQVAIVVRYSPHLTHLDLGDIRINNEQDLNFISTILARSVNLETIELKLSTPDKNLEDKVVPSIFFSCPSRVKNLDISLNSTRQPIASPSSSIFAGMEGLPMKRQDPLLQLTTLRLRHERGFDSDVLCSIFDHCPDLTTLDIPYLRNTQDAEGVGRHIANGCPKLAGLTCDVIYLCEETERVGLEASELLGAAIINAMPQDQLVSISFSGRRTSDSYLNSSLLRHGASLTTITFDDCRTICNKDIKAILRQCSVLKVLVITSESNRTIEIGARDLATCEWASNAIQELRVTVSFGTIAEIKAMRTSPTDPLESVITEKQKNGKTALGLLYRRIKSLVDLKELELTVYLHDDGPSPQWPVFSGPGCLMGGEAKTGEPFKFVRQDWSEYMQGVMY